jgi:antirestriction protein ArdC
MAPGHKQFLLRDSKAVVIAASKAEKAADYILGKATEEKSEEEG